MIEKKLSIIVPVYKVEAYLDKSVESIVSQTYKNLEIILVDDGSTDNCPQMCDEWKKKDKRIKVIHKENGGLSSARNSGIEAATGEYIAFVDSDDWLECDVYEKSIEILNQENADVVIYGIKKVDEEGNVISINDLNYEVIENNDIEKKLYRMISGNYFGYAWNKVYRAEVIKKSGIRNNSNIIDREDLAFNLELIPYINRIVCANIVGYYYLQRETSLLHIKSLKRLEGVNAFCDFMIGINIKNKDEKKRIYNFCVKQYVSDCIVKNILWNTALSKKEKKHKMDVIFSDDKIRNNLTEDKDEPRYLRALYKSFYAKNHRNFYRFFVLSEIKRKVLLLFR